MRFFLTRLFLAGLLGAVNAACSTVPPDITKTVVFIYTDEACTPQHAYGTGFLMRIPVPTHPNSAWIYLVTAQHVLHSDGNNLNSPLLKELFVRMNKVSADSLVVPVPIVTTGPQRTVFLSPDPDIDVAVLPIKLPENEKLDIESFDENFLATTDAMKQMNIAVGTDMFFAGMFAPYQGRTRNQPIVRFGRLAMIPEEKIDFGGHQIDAYLVESFSFGGNSGSPVFFYPSSDNTPGRITMGYLPVKIAGVMKGFYGDLEPIQLAQVTQQRRQVMPVSQSNTGIAVVVPAKYIKEILHSPELEAMRQTELSNISQ